jgi:hypothetical protein
MSQACRPVTTFALHLSHQTPLKHEPEPCKFLPHINHYDFNDNDNSEKHDEQHLLLAEQQQQLAKKQPK